MAELKYEEKLLQKCKCIKKAWKSAMWIADRQMSKWKFILWCPI